MNLNKFTEKAQETVITAQNLTDSGEESLLQFGTPLLGDVPCSASDADDGAFIVAQWLDREIGIGPASLRVFARTQRCEATNVDPGTGARDLAIPAALMRTWGHQDFGIYARVTAGGIVAVGAPVSAPLTQ